MQNRHTIIVGVTSVYFSDTWNCSFAIAEGIIRFFAPPLYRLFAFGCACQCLTTWLSKILLRVHSSEILCHDNICVSSTENNSPSTNPHLGNPERHSGRRLACLHESRKTLWFHESGRGTSCRHNASWMFRQEAKSNFFVWEIGIIIYM